MPYEEHATTSETLTRFHHFHQLPGELQVYIGHLAEATAVLSHLSKATSRVMRQYALSRFTTYTLSIKDLKDPLAFASTLTKGDWIKLNFSKIGSAVDEEVLLRFIEKFPLSPDVKGCDFRQLNAVTDKVLASVAAKFPLLKEINLSNCPVSDEAVFTLLSKCNNLETLILSGCEGITGDIIAKIATLPPYSLHIQSLDISYCSHIDVSQISLLTRYLKLQSLNVAGLPRADAILYALIEEPHFLPSSLDLSYCSELTNYVFSRLVDHVIDTLTLSSSLFHLDYIHALRLSGCGIGSGAITNLHHIFPKLRSLDLSYCSHIDSAALLELKNCSHLEELTLSKIPLLSDQDLLFLMTALPTLKSLDVSGCPNFTQEGMQAITQCKSTLEKINLTGCIVSYNTLVALCRAFPNVDIQVASKEVMNSAKKEAALPVSVAPKVSVPSSAFTPFSQKKSKFQQFAHMVSKKVPFLKSESSFANVTLNAHSHAVADNVLRIVESELKKDSSENYLYFKNDTFRQSVLHIIETTIVGSAKKCGYVLTATALPEELHTQLVATTRHWLQTTEKTYICKDEGYAVRHYQKVVRERFQAHFEKANQL